MCSRVRFETGRWYYDSLYPRDKQRKVSGTLALVLQCARLRYGSTSAFTPKDQLRHLLCSATISHSLFNDTWSTPIPEEWLTSSNPAAIAPKLPLYGGFAIPCRARDCPKAGDVGDRV